MTRSSDDAPARLLADRFELGEVLGRGGMATVWSAVDTRLGRTVAVKILRDDLSADHAHRIEREARAAARIDDRRVVTVLDLHHDDDGRPFLVFEALSGRTLADELRDGALPRPRAERLTRDLLAALASAHACGVLHRDVKPSNVLVDGEGFRITDFGIASLDDETATEGDLMGTLRYLAPERFEGAPATPRSDVFSAAAVIYEAFGGEPAFRGSTTGEALERLRQGRVEPLGDRIPTTTWTAVRRGLNPDPDLRPADATAMLAVVTAPGAADDGHDVMTPTEPVAAALDDATQPLDATAAMPAPAPAVVADSGAGRTIPEPAGRPDRDEVVERVRRAAGRPGVAIAAIAVVLVVAMVALLVTRDDGSGAAESDGAPPAEQFERNLDRIQELG